MGILIGMDEAGYGPNFGPLVVAATAWDVSEEAVADLGRRGSAGRESLAEPDVGVASAVRPTLSGTAVCESPGKLPGLCDVDLYRLLRPVVSKSASERRIAIADSKALYHPGLGLRQLERGVHAVLSAIGQSLRYSSALVEYCRADPDGHHCRHCWPAGHDNALPIDAADDEIERLGTRFEHACASTGVRPLLVRARLVFPAEFNDLVEHYGTKGAALSHLTVGLLREVMEAIRHGNGEKGTGTDRECLSNLPNEKTVGASPLFAVCDKHGGRNFYGSLLQHHFSEHWIAPVFERHGESRYEWGPAESRVRVSFRMNGERFLPTALASMTAKYLRELSMRAFNEFWRARVPGLRPTAGYPLDARRFKRDIEAAQRNLGICDRMIWRNK